MYSFGILMWELFHEQVPFDNDVASATEIICQNAERPRIDEQIEDDSDEEALVVSKCTNPIANIIRKCW